MGTRTEHRWKFWNVDPRKPDIVQLVRDDGTVGYVHVSDVYWHCTIHNTIESARRDAKPVPTREGGGT